MDQKKSYYYSLAAYRKRVTKYGQCALAAEKQKKFSCRITPAYAQRLYLQNRKNSLLNWIKMMAKAGIDFMKMPRHVQLAVIEYAIHIGEFRLYTTKMAAFLPFIKNGQLF